MTKLTTSDLSSLSNETSAINTINNNFAATETAMENTLSRDGTSPNQMEADLDMNGNDILNVGALLYADGSAIDTGISGPNPSVDNSIPRWDGTTGAALDDSGWTISDSDVMTAGATLDMSGNSITNVLSLTMTGGGNLDLNCGDLLDIGNASFCPAGSLDMNWAPMKAHCEYTDSESSSSNAITLDLENGNYFYTTLTENISTVTFTIGAASGEFVSWAWEITQDAGASGYTITWPAAVQWAGGTAPTLTATASAVDIISFWTRDGGTTIYASVAGADFS